MKSMTKNFKKFIHVLKALHKYWMMDQRFKRLNVRPISAFSAETHIQQIVTS